MILLALFAVAAIILFVLAGLKVGAPRFDPAWFGVACAAVVVLFPALKLLSGH